MQPANFFADGSPFLYHPLLTTVRTTAEIDFLLAQFELDARSRILDIGCGFGRHTIELARRGYHAVGIDLSPAMIAAARVQTEMVDASFIRADGATFVADQPFDAAVCLFTTLGQIADADDNRGLVDNVFNLLRSGGYFAVETPQRDATVSNLKRTERFGGGDAYTDVERHFDADTHIMAERFRVVAPQSEQDFILRYRLFSAAELTAIMRNAGFEIEGHFSNYRGDALDVNSPTMLIIGQKA